MCIRDSTRTVQDEQSKDWCGEIWAPPRKFRWSDEAFAPKKDEPLLIYECHIGMAEEEYSVGS